MNGSDGGRRMGHEPAEGRPRGRWLVLLPVAMAVLGILIAAAAVTTGQDARRTRDQIQLDKDRFYWENELAQAELAQASPERLAEIDATLEQVRQRRLISYARFGRQFTQWDGYRYEEIVEQGYAYHLPGDPEDVKDDSGLRRPGWPEKRTKNVVWYPLYPAVGWVVKEATGLPANWALTAVSWVCAVAGAVMVFLVARRHAYERREQLHVGDGPQHGEMVAGWTTALLLFGPCSVFFYANFTESLFVLLLATFLYCIQRRWWWRAAMVAAVASSCRSQGVLFGPILALAHLVRQDGPWGRRIGKAVVLGAVSGIGLACYMAYLQWEFQDALAFLHAQKYWGVGLNGETIANAVNPMNALRHVARYATPGISVDWPRLWEAVCLFWPPVVLLVWRRRLSLELGLVGWLLWGLPYVSNGVAGFPKMDTPWMSMGRFMAVMLPAQLIAGMVAMRRWWAGLLLMVCSASVFGVFAYKFGNGEWVG